MASDLQYRAINLIMRMPTEHAPKPAQKAIRNFRAMIDANVPIVDITNVLYMLLRDDGSSMFDATKMLNYMKPLTEEMKEQQSMWEKIKGAAKKGVGLNGFSYVRNWWPFDHAIFSLHNAQDGYCLLVGIIRGDSDDYLFRFHNKGFVEIVDNTVASMRSEATFAEPHFAVACNVAQALCMAKNANFVETAPQRATRKRYPSVAGIRFSHIEIDMGRPKRTGERRNEDPEHGVPWHHRRGHWAYYHPDRPAFGRPGAHGWYWRPFTEVGDKAFGEVVQDYTVAVPIAPGEP